ncbi:hypothetical protein MCUN1_001760 [Malassezia cuniculi]|uniref:Nitronate monooxygenase n=1 Tax=Malassezia cuniculi TaxID=948313 RepID=A0AAF0ER48_9BASI|nr:hypothetical protein MCUN1_001760 [Malassezia cuniculi]
MIKTQLTEKLGLRVPLVMGGMQWVGTPQLAVKVTNAGALGLVTALTQPTPEDLKKALIEAQKQVYPDIAAERKDKFGSLGVNITLLPAITPPDYPAYARAALDAGIRIFETAGNNPGPVIKILKDAGAFVIHKCTTVQHGLKAASLGADMLSIDGFECAGHPGEQDIGGLVLLALAAEKISIPFIASGGIANGRGLAAALVLGAQGANMGTRFMATAEAEVHDNIKNVMVEKSETNTIHILRSFRNTARVYRSPLTEEVVEMEKRGAAIDEILPLVSGKRGKQVYETGDPNLGVWTTGVSIGLIHDIPTVREIVTRIEREAEEYLQKGSALVVPKSRL